MQEIETAAAGSGTYWRAPAAQADPRVELAAVRLPGSLATTLAVPLFAVGAIAILRMVMHSWLPG